MRSHETGRGWRAHIPIVGPALVKLAQPENHILEAAISLAAVGYGLVLVAAVVPAAKGNSWLSAVGTTFLSVGTSASLAIIVAKHTALEGYRKEANLRRKDEVYAPLYDELKGLQDLLAGAEEKCRPYPQWVEVQGQAHPKGAMFIPGYEPPTLAWWPTLKADHRIEHFGMSARHVLDATLERAAAYNAAAVAVRKPVRDLLERALEDAIADVTQDAKYEPWFKRHREADPQQFPSNLSHLPRPVEEADARHQLYAAIAYGLSYATPQMPIYVSWAGRFLEGLPIQQPITLGWLLADRPDEAGQFIYQTLVRQEPQATAPQEWYEGLFARVCEQLPRHDEYQTFRTDARALHLAVGAGTQRIADGLAYIRDRYEGGAPPV